MTILKFVQRFQKLYMQTAVYNNAAILTREIRWAERHRIRHPNWFRKIFDAWNPWGPGEALRQGFRMKPLATDEQAVSLTFSFSNRHQYSKRNGFHCGRLSTPYVGRRISSVPAFVWIFSMLRINSNFRHLRFECEKRWFMGEHGIFFLIWRTRTLGLF